MINNVSDELRLATLEFLYKYVNEGIDDIKMQEGNERFIKLIR
jgi:hypothetical protein